MAGRVQLSQDCKFWREAGQRGEYLLLLNNDTEVISPDFIEEMMGYCSVKTLVWWAQSCITPTDLLQHAGILVGVRGAIAHANQDFQAIGKATWVALCAQAIFRR